MRLPADCTLPVIRDIRDGMFAALSTAQTLQIDAGDVASLDLSFVQLIASASASARAAGKTLSVSGLSDVGRSIFLRTGLDIDSAGTLVNA